jgi:hypothetical protein
MGEWMGECVCACVWERGEWRAFSRPCVALGDPPELLLCTPAVHRRVDGWVVDVCVCMCACACVRGYMQVRACMCVQVRACVGTCNKKTFP